MKLLHFVWIIDHVKWLFFRAKAGQRTGFRIMLKYFEIKKALRYYIKQIDSMLPCLWFSKRSQKTSKCGKNISDTLGYASCPTFLSLPHFDVICDLILNRRTATWNLFVNYSTPLYVTLRYATLCYSTLLYPTLRYSTLLYFTLLYSTLLYATLLYSSLLYSMLLYATVRYSIYATLRYATLLYATLRYSKLLYATLLYSTLLYATLLYSTLL